MNKNSGASADSEAKNETKPPVAAPTGGLNPLPNAQLRSLKARGQLLKPALKIGKEGLTPGFFAALDDALARHELVKVKFDDFKEQKKELAPQLAEKSGAHLVMRVGNVVVLFRRKPTEPAPKG
jgi:RNA-binding protein